MAGSFDGDNNFISSGFLSLKEADGMGKKERKGKGKEQILKNVKQVSHIKTKISYQKYLQSR